MGKLPAPPPPSVAAPRLDTSAFVAPPPGPLLDALPFVAPPAAGRPAAAPPAVPPIAPPPARGLGWPPAGRLALPLAAVAAALVLAVLLVRPAAPAPPLHTTAGVSASAAGWAPEFTDARGRPARWDPCLAIHYVVDDRLAPYGGLADVKQAVATVAADTGMTFVFDGTTDEVPARGRAAYQPDRYGHRWAPLLIGWVPPSGTDLLGDRDAEGVTVPVAVSTDAGGVIVTAEVALNTARQMPVGFGPGGSEGEVLLHELGHAVGLAHVNDPAQAMFPTSRGVAAYGAGDLAGLAALGRPAGCIDVPAPRRLQVAPVTSSQGAA